ncbi:hypothetical protein EST38_g6362 [Candolleomyces aberdarensis]|uniref:Ricin B lectin domain-containing protein n=1 Tax=Candolleomyces aberdarensis TaxID=2316362 RepID=A0A4Q2DL72_9AGAR|nr:hypothetical protein EST38_g6362 [Candolleomyces aberdarensis]
MTLARTLLLLAATVTPLLANPIAEKRQIPFRQYRIWNECPDSINLYIGGQFDTAIASGGNTTKFLAESAGFFYTDANGGNANGAGTTKVGFSTDFYYMVRDGEGPLNTGLAITPQDRPAQGGFCTAISCNESNCPTAYPAPPTRFPPVTSTPPPPPLYRCPFANTTYQITFCPSGQWPGPQTFRIHPTLVHPEKCLDVRGAVFANGTPVQIYDCNGTPAQNWILSRGSTKVQLAGTNFCLDASSTPGNGVGIKIWQCYDNLPAQQWYYTADNRIALEGQGQCLDLTSGTLTNGNQVQTWQCTDSNQNQVWSL